MAYSEPSSVDDAMSAQCAIDYELAGRLPSQTFQDLRSASKARRRHRANLEKYYSYRHVNAGQLGRAHHQLPTSIFEPQPLPSDAPTATMTKQTLYREAQRYPRPPTYHRCHPDFTRGPVTSRKARRKYERRHAVQRLNDDVGNSRDPSFVAYVVGHGDGRHVDLHVFRRCDYCWAEYEHWYVDDEMFDGNGDAVGEWEDSWEVAFGHVEFGRKRGFAGRGKVGALFLMGTQEWRKWPERRSDEGWYEYREDDENWEDDERREDHNVETADDEWERYSWVDLDMPQRRDEQPDSDWEVLSSGSSWSQVSGQNSM